MTFVSFIVNFLKAKQTPNIYLLEYIDLKEKKKYEISWNRNL